MKLVIDYSDMSIHLLELERKAESAGLLKNLTFEEWLTDYVKCSIFELFEDFEIDE